MQIQTIEGTLGGTNGTVRMNSQDHLSVAYVDPRGTEHIFNISAQNLVFMVVHEKTEAAILCRPSAPTGNGVEFVQPTK